MKEISNQEKLLAVFVILATFLRLIPHPLNFTPITSLALFSGVMFNRKWLGLIIPLIAMFLSDIILGFSMISFWVYASFGLITLFGWFIKKMNIHSILLSSIIFFIVSNFGVWVLGYPHTIEGILLCYTMAIPFFGYSIIGDLFWGFVIKFSYKFVENKIYKTI
jgi:uncharacterized membrane protein